jgi:hypothetical protein
MAFRARMQAAICCCGGGTTDNITFQGQTGDTQGVWFGVDAQSAEGTSVTNTGLEILN